MRDAFTHTNGDGHSNCGDFGDAYSNRNGYSNFDAYTHGPATG